jgi:rSAM/selenodomain-associated transferase 1
VPPTIVDAFVFESTNRFITVVFRVVPLRIGVDEAGTAMFADLLQFGATTGVTLAVVRKARMLVWIAAGVTLLMRRGLSVDAVLSDEETARTSGRIPDGAVSATAVVVMARPPSGPVAPKSRLAGAGLTDDERRALYAAFLTDTVAACRRVNGASLKVAFTPEATSAVFDDLGVATGERMLQRGDDLGERERHLFEDLFAQGFAKVVLVGSDLPTLPAEHIRQAIAWLDESAVAIGPSSDGGYYLLGLMKSARGVPDLFSRIRWSSPHAYEDTIWAAGLSGLRVEQVPQWYDVDDEEGLTRLRKDLSNPERAARAPATARVIDKLFG